jgi:Ca-activated chloride channel family protein
MTSTMPPRLLFVAAFICAVSLVAYGASPAPSPQHGQPIDATAGQVFKSHSDLVVLHVNVFDQRSDAVPNLAREHFAVFEDDRQQEITFFSGEDVPVAAGLVVDNSSSMIARYGLVVSGAMAFANSSHPEDELFTVHFNEYVRPGLPPETPFTSSRAMLRSAFAAMKPGGKTALHDAVIEALDRVEQANHQKHVIIVLSDGEDNASRHTRKEMYDRAVRSNVMIYTVATDDGLRGGSADPNVLRRLAKIGGGLSYFPRANTDVVDAFTEIARNVRRGYSIGYTPSNTSRDGAFRRVRVAVRVPGRKLTVRCRDGYTAPGPASAQ